MNEIYKIRTKQSRIITLTVISETPTHYHGVDKFGKDVILPKADIDRLIPLQNVS